MSNDTVPQPEDLTTRKRTDAVHGDRWSVSGVHGTVSYRELGGHVAVRDTRGDRDSAVGRWPVRCATAAETGDDQAVYAVLAELYEANFGGAR